MLTALCEEGMQLNNTTEACEPCPVGFYKNVSANDTGFSETDRFRCKMCPENKTTYDTGASSVQQCIGRTLSLSLSLSEKHREQGKKLHLHSS